MFGIFIAIDDSLLQVVHCAGRERSDIIIFSTRGSLSHTAFTYHYSGMLDINSNIHYLNIKQRNINIISYPPIAICRNINANNFQCAEKSMKY